jgi:hypothetical protein
MKIGDWHYSRISRQWLDMVSNDYAGVIFPWRRVSN